jgi:hypothetical protein
MDVDTKADVGQLAVEGQSLHADEKILMVDLK